MTKHRMFSIWLAAITLVVVYVAVRDTAPAGAAPPRKRLVLEELDVQRINVIEPDGKPRVIVTNHARFPGAYFGGKEYPHPGREVGAGLLFFNDQGTEAGGLVYASRKDDKGMTNAALLSFDQFEQNEVMTLDYGRRDGKRRAGLTVRADHPEASLLPVIQAHAQLATIKDPAARQEAEQRFRADAKRVLGDWSTRVFVGKDGEDAQLVLGDNAGKPRLVLKVDARGEPTIELLDADGKVAKRIGVK